MTEFNTWRLTLFKNEGENILKPQIYMFPNHHVVLRIFVSLIQKNSENFNYLWVIDQEQFFHFNQVYVEWLYN